MSGGSYDYAYEKIQEMAANLRVDGSSSAAPPTLRKAFAAHLLKVAEACRAIEWNDSGDGDDHEIKKILAVLPSDAELTQAFQDAMAACKYLDDAIARAREVQSPAPVPPGEKG